MNIIEAIKSGKRFRRRGQPRYLELFHDIDLCLSAVDITADDWEVEDVPVPLTKEQFLKAWDRAVGSNNNMDIYAGLASLRYLVAKELGL